MAPDADKKNPGPEADRLKLDEDEWGDAVKKALEKKRPDEGWPEPEEGKPGREDG